MKFAAQRFDHLGRRGHGDLEGELLGGFVAEVGNYNASDDVFIFEGGYNNYTNVAGTVEADIAAMVSALTDVNPTARYLVMGIPTGEHTTPGYEYTGGAGRAYIDAINANLLSTYGAASGSGRFIDINSHLVSQYDPGTPQDVIDFGHGIVPSTLRNDAIHWDTDGQNKVYLHLLSLFHTRGWDFW